MKVITSSNCCSVILRMVASPGDAGVVHHDVHRSERRGGGIEQQQHIRIGGDGATDPIASALHDAAASLGLGAQIAAPETGLGTHFANVRLERWAGSLNLYFRLRG